MTHVLVRFLAGMVGQVDVLRLESRGLRGDGLHARAVALERRAPFLPRARRSRPLMVR